MERIGRYLVRRFLTDSSFSRLYLAWDGALHRYVAIKVFALEPDVCRPPLSYAQWRTRFRQEGEVMAKIDHPNVLPIYESGQLSTGRPYLVLPFIRCNLPSLIGFDEQHSGLVAKYGDRALPHAIPASAAVPILVQIMRALAHLHGHGIVHRDIKAANILLSARENPLVRLCDFGMAKVGSGEDMARGAWIGSLDYISPEQRRDAGLATDRSDVYSAAVLAWRMLTGRLPDKEARLGLSVPGVPVHVARAIHQALAPRPEDRPSATDLLGEFSRPSAARLHLRRSG